MIKAIWNLFLAIIAKPAKLDSKLECVENAPIKHYYPIPANFRDFTAEEKREYALQLTKFILANSI
jgi:hypothetical protein